MGYEKLFEPGQIGSIKLKNRGVMVPMATNLADRDGLVTPRQIRYYQERAKGGVSLIINEYTGVDDVDSIPSIYHLRASRDYHISSLEELTDAVHLYDCKVVAQLHHGGATSNPELTGRQNLAPSAVPIAPGQPVPREMTREDIRRVQEKFVAAAVRCYKAGYDGVELHGAHGYLIAQFFSKYYNRRTDAYGGSTENRCRFLAEIIAGIREKLGDYPILVRMCGDEMTPIQGFLTLEDGLEIARYLERCGIDALDVSNGSARNGDANCEPYSYRPGWKKHVAKAYKQALHIPILATNTVKDPDFAEALLEEGVCDFVGLGRAQLADPDFMRKAAAGKPEEIRECIGCLYCRERVLGKGLPIRCSVNARTAREITFSRLRRDGGGRTVAVVGGGPAGMEAARVLALRGFHVVLLEAQSRLGGTLNIADRAAFKEQLTRLVASMQAQLTHLDVEICLGTCATPEILRSLHPVGVVAACGAEPMVPPLPGIDGGQVCTAEAVLAGKAQPQGQVVVIGSGLTGLETASELLQRGASVCLVEMADQLGPGIFGAVLQDKLRRITPYQPKIYTGHKLCGIAPGIVLLECQKDGSLLTVKAGNAVLALGVRPRQELVRALEREFSPFFCVGDARQGGNIAAAIRHGFEAGAVLEA